MGCCCWNLFPLLPGCWLVRFLTGYNSSLVYFHAGVERIPPGSLWEAATGASA